MAAGWEQAIAEKLQELNSIAVRFDIEQELTDAEKARARNNISAGATATQVSGDNYKITIS